MGDIGDIKDYTITFKTPEEAVKYINDEIKKYKFIGLNKKSMIVSPLLWDYIKKNMNGREYEDLESKVVYGSDKELESWYHHEYEDENGDVLILSEAAVRINYKCYNLPWVMREYNKIEFAIDVPNSVNEYMTYHNKDKYRVSMVLTY